MLYTPYEFGEDLRPLGEIEYEYLIMQLGKIGKSLFVEHFYSFKRRNRDLLDHCPPNNKYQIYRERIFVGYAICELGLDMHALYTIINSPRARKEIRVTAKQIYDYELLMAKIIAENTR